MAAEAGCTDARLDWERDEKRLLLSIEGTGLSESISAI